MSKTIYIMRGLPGSGKSFLAKEICNSFRGVGTIVLSTDDIWTAAPNNEYLWVGEFIGAAHKITQAKVREACRRGIPRIIVDNTNTTFREMEPYVRIAEENGYAVNVVEPATSWAFDVEECARRNTHKVPREVVQKMADRFESSSDILEKIKNYSIEE